MIPLLLSRRATAALFAASSLVVTLLFSGASANAASGDPTPTEATSAEAARPLRPGPGYWLAGSDGGVFAFGEAPYKSGDGTGTPSPA